MQPAHSMPSPSRFFYRALVRHLLTLFLPIVSLVCVLVVVIGVVMFQTQQTRIQERLETLNETVTEALNASHWIGSNLANTRNIIPSLLADNTSMQDALTRQLDSYRASNGLYSEVIASYRQVPNNLFTSRGSIDIEQLSPFLLLDEDVDTYPAVLERIQSPILLTASYGMHSSSQPSVNFFESGDLLYITPVKLTTSNTRYLTLLTVIDRARLNYMAEQETDAWPGIVLMLNSGSRLAFHSGSALPQELDAKSWAEVTDQETSGAYTLYVQGEQGDVIRFVFAADTAALRGQAFESIFPVVVCGGVAVLLGLLLCLFLSLNAYWPIVRLRRLLSSAHGSAHAPSVAEHVDAVSELIYQDGMTVGSQIQQLTSTMQTALVRRVLDGDIIQEEEIARLVSEARINLHGPLYVALCMHLNRAMEEGRRHQLTFALQQEIDWPYGIIPIVAPDRDDSLAFVASLPAGLGTEQHRELLLSLVRTALAAYDFEATIGSSHVKQAVGELREAYLEAQSALMLSDPFSTEPSLSPAAAGTEDRLHTLAADISRQVRAGELSGIPDTVAMWFDSLKEAPEAGREPRMIQMLDLVFEALIDCGYLPQHRAETLLSRCLSAPSAEETQDRLAGILEALSGGPSTRQEDADARVHSRMASYLEDHVFDPLFSMTMMADDFDMPVVAFGRLFKRHFRQTFINYVSQMRIDRAKALLSDTDMLLKEIVETIGYVDVSNFIRKFKLIVGVTPGEYRKQHSKKGSPASEE